MSPTPFVVEIIREYMKKSVKAIVAALIIGSILTMAHVTERFDSYVRDRVVKLVGAKGGLCSGEQVIADSGKSYILTAAHCKPLADEAGSIAVIDENGKMMRRRIIAEDGNSDLLLLEGIPYLDGIKIAEEVRMGAHVRTFTHGAGKDTYRTEGNLIQYEQAEAVDHIMADEKDVCPALPKFKQKKAQIFFMEMELCILSVQEMVSTAMTVPGSSGGMVVDDYGHLVGVVSMGDGIFSYFVTLEHIQNFMRGR